MRHRFGIPIVLALCALALAAAASAEITQKGNLRIAFGGGFSPHALPRERPAPVTVSIEGRITTTDGSHPPALRRFEVQINRQGRISTRGLPSCAASLLQATSTATAVRRCRAAIVGSGRFEATVASDEKPVPADGRIVAFNGSTGGRTALLLHFHLSKPVQATLILPMRITRQKSGRFGTVLTAVVPKLAGGVGSITEIELEIGRQYAYEGSRRSFVSASCAAPAGFPGASFTFAKGRFEFADGRALDASMSRDCRVR